MGTRFVSIGAGVLALAGIAGVSSGALYTTHSTEAGFNLAVGGAGNVVGQDFQGFTEGDDMTGAGTFLSGVEATTNLGSLEILGTSKRMAGFNGGTTVRADEEAYYQFDYSVPYLGAAFWIASWDPESSPATIEVFLEGGASDSFQVSQTGASESDDPVFVGITSGLAITRIVIHEPIENNGGNEEVAFSWVGVSRLPAPGAVATMALGMVGIGARRRRATV